MTNDDPVTSSEKSPDDVKASFQAAETYDEMTWSRLPDETRWSAPLHEFGKHQNQFNRDMVARMRALEVENRTLRLQIERLESELFTEKNREKKSLGRLAAELDQIHTEMNRLQVLIKLNGNAIERLMKADDPEESSEQKADLDEEN